MLMAIAAAHWLWRSLDTSSTSPLHTNLYITTRAGAFTNLPTAGKVVYHASGDVTVHHGKRSGLAPALHRFNGG